MKKGQIYEGVVDNYLFPNKGYVTIEDRNICIKGALKGQKVRFLIKRLKKGAGEGRLLEVLEKSAVEDVNPSCPHFGICGGCAYRSMSYENQLQLKKNMVKTILDNVIGDSYIWEGIKGSPVTSAYRNKMEYSFGDEYKDGPLALGMHKKGSFHDIVTVDSCEIVDDDYNRIIRALIDFYEEKGVPFYKKMQHVGVLRHLVIRRSATNGDILVNLVTTTKDDLNINDSSAVSILNKEDGLSEAGADDNQVYEELWKRLYIDELKDRLLSLELSGKIAGILHTSNDSLADAVIPQKISIVYGEDHLYEELLGLRFKISPFSFFQTNTRSAEVLYETTREYVLMSEGKADKDYFKDKVIFDLYSGTGTIAQMLAPVAKKVVGIEIVEEAVEAAKENAALNGLDNCEFIAGDVLKVLDEVEEKPDMIVLDPPRDGCNHKALNKIIAYGVPEMVYISCKPTSLARDLVTLQANGYKVVKACAVDQFPATLHVETVCLLGNTRKKPDDRIEISIDVDELYSIASNDSSI